MGQNSETPPATSVDYSGNRKEDLDGDCMPLEKGHVTFWLVLSSLTAAMCGSFQFGYQLAVLTGPSMMMQQFYNASNYDRRGVFLSEAPELWLWSTTLSVLCIGGGIGALAAGHMADAFGRKGAMLLVDFFSIAGGSLMGLSYLARSYVMVIAGRLVIGFYVGFLTFIYINSDRVKMYEEFVDEFGISRAAFLFTVYFGCEHHNRALYLAEISPVNLRGAVGLVHQLMIAVGIVTSQGGGPLSLYLAEITPVNLGGAVGLVHQLMVAFGIVASQVLGLFVFYHESGWPVLLALTSVPSVLQLFIFPFCPESPRWLFIKAREEIKAGKVLKKLRGTDAIEGEIAQLRREAERSLKSEKVGIPALFRLENPVWKRPLIITALINVFQQFAGINAIMFYATEIFYEAGMGETQVAFSTVGLGVLQVAMAFTAAYLVETAGRRPLLIYPYAAMAVCSGLLAVSLNLQERNPGWKWFSLVLIYVYVINFAVGPGPVTYLLVPELWTQGPRSAAMSVAIQTKWFANLVVGLVFPFLQETIGAYVFLAFLFFCSATSAFVYYYVPETKGRSFEDIVGDFDREQIPNESLHMNPSYHKNLDQ